MNNHVRYDRGRGGGRVGGGGRGGGIMGIDSCHSKSSGTDGPVTSAALVRHLFE